MEMVNSFKRYLRAIVPHIVYKSSREAEKYETGTTRLAGDEFVAAMLRTDNWMAVRPKTLSVKVLNAVGIYDNELIMKIRSEDIYLVPEEKRAKALELRRQEIIQNYTERNNYYRMLAGLPDLNADSIYLSPTDLAAFGYTKDSIEDYNADRLDNLTPLHELPQTVLNAMEKQGFLDEIYATYSELNYYNAEYIKYLGARRIDIVTARTAGHFELLYVPRPDNANRFNRDFILYYEEARNYILSQVYNFHYSANYDFYESYMGFFILVMAIQRMVDSMFEVMVDRDFYDLETCRMFLDAYGVPFIDTLTLRQQKTLVKNLNILIMNKCTSQVMYDILSLIEYDNYDLTKYLLVKQHKTAQVDDESEPKPIFIYRTVLDDDGNASYELDKTQTYDYYFVGVPMNENDIDLVEITDANAHSYESVTVPDSLWIEDRELVEKLQEAEINYVETKYTNIAITLHMQEVVFEHIYLQKMLCDKKYETSNITVDISMISPTPVSLFELEVMLICIMCKYYKTEPDLLTSPSQALAVLGFNFDLDLEAIRHEITSHPDLYSQKLVSYIKDIYFSTTSDVNEMYRNVRELNRLLVETMQITQDERVYHATKKLYNALLVTDVHNEVFALPDGSIPETYMDWLKAYDFPIYTYIDELEPEACVDKINYIATKMSTMFVDAEYLKYLNPVDTTIVNGIIRLLRWFKSYTIDINDMEVIYLFDSRYYNLMKMMTRMWFHASMSIKELDIGYHEWINAMSAVMKKKETRGKLFDFIRTSSKLDLKDFFNLMRDSTKLVARISPKDLMMGMYSDTIVYLKGTGYIKLVEKGGSLYDSIYSFADTYLRDNVSMQDLATNMSENEILREIMSTRYSDTPLFGTKYKRQDDKQFSYDVIEPLVVRGNINDTQDNHESVNTRDVNIKIRENIGKPYSDNIISSGSILLSDKIGFVDSIKAARVQKDDDDIEYVLFNNGLLVPREDILENFVENLVSSCNMKIYDRMAMSDTRCPLKFIIHDS